MPHKPKANTPNKDHRDAITYAEFYDRLFPDEAVAEDWFIKTRWSNSVTCPKCGSTNTKEKASKTKLRTWRCRDCVSNFTAKTNSVLHGSHLSFRDWAFAIYQFVSDVSGVSSLKLHRDLGCSRKTSWHLGHRIRHGLDSRDLPYTGPVEVDESYFDGKEKTKHKNKRRKVGRGVAGKSIVVAAKDRKTNRISVKVVKSTKKPELHKFVNDNASSGSKVYTDEHPSYNGMDDYHHESVKHRSGEYVRYTDLDKIHTNGVEGFWSQFKGGYRGTYHSMSKKHLERYAKEFAGRHNIRDMDTLEQMEEVVRIMDGKTLSYDELVGKAA